jgi:hypothetical protein
MTLELRAALRDIRRRPWLSLCEFTTYAAVMLGALFLLAVFS